MSEMRWAVPSENLFEGKEAATLIGNSQQRHGAECNVLRRKQPSETRQQGVSLAGPA